MFTCRFHNMSQFIVNFNDPPELWSNAPINHHHHHHHHHNHHQNNDASPTPHSKLEDQPDGDWAHFSPQTEDPSNATTTTSADNASDTNHIDIPRRYYIYISIFVCT